MPEKIRSLEISVILKDRYEYELSPLSYPQFYVYNGKKVAFKDTPLPPETHIKMAYNADATFQALVKDQELINKIVKLCYPNGEFQSDADICYLSDLTQLQKFYLCLINNTNVPPEENYGLHDIIEYGRRWLSWVKSGKTRLRADCEREDYTNHVIVLDF